MLSMKQVRILVAHAVSPSAWRTKVSLRLVNCEASPLDLTIHPASPTSDAPTPVTTLLKAPASFVTS